MFITVVKAASNIEFFSGNHPLPNVPKGRLLAELHSVGFFIFGQFVVCGKRVEATCVSTAMELPDCFF